ncbi:MAG: ribose 5-phosphate isomerase A [Candidatus Thorarchaeota archaeon]|nr:ribose 5-phosphate isomerase A [Candidatus Thorarchaeota archaeon]
MSHAKKHAAESALKLVPSEGVIGLGSGSTVAVFAELLGQHISEGRSHVAVVPSSFQAYQLAITHNIPLTNLDLSPELDLTVDGADEVDRDLNLTKGGGGALFQEKIVASASKQLVIIIDESKLVDRLASRFLIPVEVLPFSLGVVMRKIRDMGISPILREAQRKMGPVVTDNGNFILDLKFPSPIEDPLKIAIDLKMIPGVVETGIFPHMAHEVHVGTDDDVYVLTRQS